jgi:hypothetical protein
MTVSWEELLQLTLEHTIILTSVNCRITKRGKRQIFSYKHQVYSHKVQVLYQLELQRTVYLCNCFKMITLNFCWIIRNFQKTAKTICYKLYITQVVRF